MDFGKEATEVDFASSEDAFDLHLEKIGPYKVESLFSKGGMSLLYLATDPKSQKPLIIKVLSPKYIKHKEVMDRFLKEAEIIRLSNHPNIVKLYEEGKWENGLFIAMEFIQGISLKQFIQEKSLSERKALEIILQVAYALLHLHSHGVIHRDLKPENILITESGEIKVIDFGIAQLLEESSHNLKGMIGTPSYMSPEQKASPESASFSSDIFSLGVITYELLLGRLSHGTIHLPLIAKSLRPILDRALKVDPEARYRDIVDFITDISQYLKQNMEKEEGGYFEELAEELEDGPDIFLKKPFSSPRLQFYSSLLQERAITGLYLDCFQSDQKQLFFFAECLKEGLKGLFYTSALRGMVQATKLSSFEGMPKEIALLNNTVASDPLGQKFSFCSLLFSFDKQELKLISGGNQAAWIIKEGHEPAVLINENPPLGAKKEADFSETSTNFSLGDAIALFSSPLSQEIAFLKQALKKEPSAMDQEFLEKILEDFKKGKGALSRSALAILIKAI